MQKLNLKYYKMPKILKKTCEKCGIKYRNLYYSKIDGRFLCYRCIQKETGAIPFATIGRIKKI